MAAKLDKVRGAETDAIVPTVPFILDMRCQLAARDEADLLAGRQFNINKLVHSSALLLTESFR